MRPVRARAKRAVKMTAIFLVIFGGYYGLLNLAWLGPWSLEPLYWKPHLTYGDSPNELYIMFRTPVACRLQVLYQVNVSGIWGPTQTITEGSPITIHEIQLGGLTPGQALKYHLEPTTDSAGFLSDAVVSDLAREFIIPTTVLFDTATRPFRFAAFGDVRPTVFGSDNHAAMTAAVRAQNPDFMLHVGDFVQAGPNLVEWARVFTTGETLFRSIPCMPTPGNHEYSESGTNATNYLEAFRLPGNESYYAYNISNAHIISLNFASGKGARDPAIQVAQMQWLDQHLASLNRSAFDWCFLLFHYPIIASGETHEGIWDEILAPVFTKNGVAIDLLFHGHVHEYERIYMPKINATSIVSGGGGSEIDPVHLGPMAGQVLELSHSFCMVGVDGLSLTLHGIFMKGGEFDTFTINTDGGIFA